MRQNPSAAAQRSGERRPRQVMLEECLRGVSGREEQALSALYDEISPLVFTICTRILGNQADAEEVTLDVFAQVWRGAAMYSAERGSVEAWLSMLARTRAIDRLRARGRRTEEPVEALAELPDSGSNPEQATEAKQRQARIRRALASLPEEQREAIELACYGGYSHSELAERMNLPLGTVKTRIRLGLLKLRQELADKGGWPR